MANVRAVKSGNWSDTTVWNTGALPTAADDVYANNFTVTIDQDITVLTLRTTSATGISAGGGFSCSTARTITCTDSTGILSGTTTCLTITTTSPNVVNVNSNISTSQTTAISTLSVTGNCTVNIVGSLLALTSAVANTRSITISSGGTLNIVGNLLTQGTAKISLLVTNNTTVNITGNVEVSGNSGLNSVVAISATTSTVNITGNVIRTARIGSVLSYAIELGANATLNLTGNVSNDATSTATGNAPTIYSTSVVYINCIGSLTAGRASNALASTNASSIHILSGPFISNEYGMFPFLVSRMHLIPTLNNYIEYRDNSTNGALPPGTVASASRMVSADTLADSPLESDVRFGVSFNDGTFTGTCKIPSASSVSINVPFDTGSVGTAYISSADVVEIGSLIWNTPTSNLTGSNTIGERMKNSSTVDTMGNQLASLL